MAGRQYKRDSDGKFAGGGGKSATKAKPSAAKPAKPAKPAATKVTAKPAATKAKPTLGEKLGLTSPEKKAYKQKKAQLNRQYQRDLNSPKYDYPNGDRDVMYKYAPLEDKLKAEYMAAKATKKKKS